MNKRTFLLPCALLLSFTTNLFSAGEELVPRIYFGASQFKVKSEDAIGCHSPLEVQNESMPPCHLFTVCDGHGSPWGYWPAVITEQSLELDLEKGLNPETNPIKVLQQALLQADELIQSKPSLDSAGTTASSALIIGNMLHLASVGDSRLIIEQENVSWQPIADHCCSNVQELARLRALGCVPSVLGCVAHKKLNKQAKKKPLWHCPVNKSSCRTVQKVIGNHGYQARFTRSLGDKKGKKFISHRFSNELVILPVPEITSISLTPENSFIIITSDGVFEDTVTNPITNQEMITVVHETIAGYDDPAEGAQAAANALINLAERRVGKDDASAIVILLDWSNGGGASSSVSEA